MPDISDEIGKACKKQHNRIGGVFLPQVCPYCFQCPIATIVAGVTGRNNQRGPLDIPDKEVQGVREWLAKVNPA